MPDETVLFHNEAVKVTVTDQRFIYGDDVTDISSIKHAVCSNSNGIKDYSIAILFTFFGLWLVTMFNGWSILGLILLINPLLVFFVKNKYWVFIVLKSGSTLDEGSEGKRMFKKEIAQGITDAINTAVQRCRVENDPRQNLNLNQAGA
jgi:hypothetical protein